MNYRLASDVLEQQFGPCEIEVLYQNEVERLAAIKALTGEVLELAMTNFDKQGTLAFRDIHEKIAAGAAMGKTFHEMNVIFTRELRAIGRHALSASFAPYIDTSHPSTVIVADIYVGPAKTRYARVAEVFSHKVQWPHSDFQLGKGNEAVLDAFPAFEIILGKV